MTPLEFLGQIQRRPLAPAYLFLGPDTYYRELCRRALIERVLAPGEREDAHIRHDLDEVSMAEVIDDARSYSLFVPRRLIWVTSAESVLPRAKASVESEDESPIKGGSAEPLVAYLKDPPPEVVMVFQASRFDFDGEDKAKLDRVRKFYSAVPAVVEFPRFMPQAARQLAVDLARQAGLKIASDEIELLVEALGADASRIAAEIEKLRLFVGEGGTVERETIDALIPDARSTTIFALVNAVARRDRLGALEALDTLVREGEYLPLALAFLGTLFRLALAAREAGVRTSQQVQAHFSKQGTPMWRARAEQVAGTASAFSKEKLETAIRTVFAADRALRDTRPDDRVVMEEFILSLTEQEATTPGRRR